MKLLKMKVLKKAVGFGVIRLKEFICSRVTLTHLIFQWLHSVVFNRRGSSDLIQPASCELESQCSPQEFDHFIVA